ncbi:hypothetical protein, partial [Escherichia coli]|uniref:hypothetical protein n=3 Tax=Enterobacteriaceae TaxID=543 RepID=UPI001BECB07E
ATLVDVHTAQPGHDMKKWLTEFFDDMRYIWGEFVREVNSVMIDDDTDALDAEYSAEWNATPDFDPRKAVNNLDNVYTHDTVHANIYGLHNDH